MPQTYTLEEIQRRVHDCRGCQLCQGRTNTVFGEGDPHASLMFIGEGPGRDEDLQGRPFVGRAGQLLDRMIGAMGLQRQQVYIGNIVKCRPPNNRTPLPEEAAACVNYIKWQIYLVRPKVIVLLGATAAHALLDDPRGIMRLRGNWLNYQGIPVMPTFHPAYLLRNENAMQDVWQDLQQVMARL
ncbi:MAG: uracil-DNA glycosylase [Victivallales bacterium]|nr:uracil-DNA glycosylase [Victivallales bacterium]